MAKTGINYVDAAHFEALLIAAGVSIEIQAGFVKVEAPNGHRMYVAKTERVGRVDFAFPTEGSKLEGIKVLSEGEKFGAVTAQLDFSREPSAILEAFTKALEHMKALPKPEVAAKAAKAKGAKPAAQGWSPEVLKATKAIDTTSSSGMSLALKLSLAENGKPLNAALFAKLDDAGKKAYLARWKDAPKAAQVVQPEAKAADKK